MDHDGRPPRVSFFEGLTNSIGRGVIAIQSRCLSARPGNRGSPPNPRSRPPRRRRTGIAPVGLVPPEVAGRPPRAAALEKQMLGGSAPEPPLPPSATPADRHRSGWAVSSRGGGAQPRKASSRSTATLRLGSGGHPGAPPNPRSRVRIEAIRTGSRDVRGTGLRGRLARYGLVVARCRFASSREA